MLSQVERQRVVAALRFNPDTGDVVSLVERLQTSEELHQFVLNYNCNDGLLPLWSIAKNSTCDLGTALQIYWLLADFVMDRESYQDASEPAWDGAGLATEIENRVSDGFYGSRAIRFAPCEYLDWSPIRLKRMKLQLGEFPFPEVMLETSPGEDLPIERL